VADNHHGYPYLVDIVVAAIVDIDTALLLNDIILP